MDCFNDQIIVDLYLHRAALPYRRTLVKSAYQKIIFLIIQPNIIYYVVGTQQNRLNETVLLRTQNIC